MSECVSMSATAAGDRVRLPVGNLLALATAGFITVLTEALPAGLLPLMSADLRVTEALIGQLVTVYALGSIVAAIPLVAATRGIARRRLLIAALAGFVVSNALTAVSPYYALTLAARFVAGMAAGLLWALLAGYASRMVDEHLRGRAIAVAMLGVPVAMSIGIPAGTAFGAAVGWRVAFAGITLAALALIGWVRLRLPDYPGQPAGSREPVLAVLKMPGVRAVLTVMFAYVLAHNMLYTYIAPFLAGERMGTQVDAVLFVFGIASLGGLGLTGAWIGAAQRRLTFASIALFALAALMLGAGNGMVIVYAGVALWGIAFGGAPTLFQTAAAQAAGDAADVAQSMLVTVWNLAIAGGGIAGGMLLDAAGAGPIPWVLVALLSAAALGAWRARGHAFAAVQRAA
ncbi:MFS transporter [Burkholderia multivorans]|uniref:MFS transporter n=1 Tax=Burkholderia multivorans TaxID=87883 RepID=UPI0008422B67|nr:MFS transporter [Burkholderia multivorans]AOJ93819.1 MFS transporter [Burkholderia multivorans]MBU9238501.1 MFS transporter [Burkholderia multivorans]MCO1343647.1 MFS transporter [Burkholderia multivorans]MCO1444108.1 MFS transporter [Burkholderia multivorans]MDN7446749.1 MFS transporter [Burkholderia multivorans]